MSEKISTIIIKVDLQCCQCSRKIKKTLCKLQDRGMITSIAYDEKKDTVTVKGPGDPKKLIKKICCDACRVIKDIQIVEDKPPPPPPPPSEPKPNPPAPKPAPPAPEPAPPAPEPAPPAPAPEPPKKEEPEPPKPEPEVKPPDPVYPYPGPGWTPGPDCCCKPWFEAYYGGCRCCSCGCIYGSHGPPPPPPPPQIIYISPPCYDGPKCYDGPNTCQFICEDDPSCRIM